MHQQSVAAAAAAVSQGHGQHQHQHQQPPPPQRPPHAKEYNFLDIELKYGILQLTEALSFLHYSGQIIHKNVCPSSIFITKKGTWKLGGFEFLERANESDAVEPIVCQPWSSRYSKLTQPNLDYMGEFTQFDWFVGASAINYVLFI